MKKSIALFFCFVIIAVLSCCAGGEKSGPEAEGIQQTEASSGEDSTQNMISSDMLSRSIYDALEAEWSAWNAKDDLQKAVSSHMPGYIYKSFDTWAECEAFVGFEIFNPLEDSEFEKGSYVGMPVGANDASRFNVSFYGPDTGQADWISVDSGYRDGDVRITVNAQILVDAPKEKMDGAEPLITEDSGEKYVATEALLARGPVTYTIRVIGDKNEWDAVRETLNKVLPYFQCF